MWLSHADNVLSDPFGELSNDQPYAEALISVMGNAVSLSRTVADGVERAFSATADAEYSDNTSRMTAARYAWVGGGSSRSYGASILVGARRSIRGNGLARVPNGYGHLGALGEPELAALERIRAVGVDPALLANDGDDLIEAMVTSYRAQHGLTPEEFDQDDLLATEGLTSQQYATAALWLANEIAVFDVPQQRVIDDGRRAATTTMELVLPPMGLLAGLDQRSYVVPTPTGTGVTTQMHLRRFQNVRRLDVAGGRGLASAVDYAGDVLVTASRAVAQASLSVTAAQRSAYTAALATATPAADSLRTGRASVCRQTNAQWQFRYAGVENYNNLEVVSGNDALRCAVTGTINGAACSLAAYRWTSSNPVVGSQGEYATAGGPYIRQWTRQVTLDNSPPTTAAPTSEVYLLLGVCTDDPEGNCESPTSYRVITGISRRNLDLQECHNVSIVPTFDAAATRLLTPHRIDETRAAGAAETSCTGLPWDQRIALEDELSNDGDQFESSWRHYLTLASEAAAEADRLGESVIETGLDIERRVEVASAKLQTLCGGAVDVDFLSSGAGTFGPAGACTGVTEGGTTTDGERGYVCRRGVAVPDALETISVRAGEGDATAKELLDCMGADSRARWVSLGSRPLCLWEDNAGNACVGAAEHGLACPVVREAGTTCEEQLVDAMVRVGTGLHAVEVDKNLGVFADLIRGSTSDPGGGSDDSVEGMPPCDALRTIRSGDPDARQEARERLLSDPWLSEPVVSHEAGRLAWEALPYDYGVLRRDGLEWAWTGDPSPSIASFPTDAWPCGATIEPGLQDETGQGTGSCAGTGTGGATQGPLGCSYATNCAVTGAQRLLFLDRVRMNQRVGRAALTLRLITAEGLADFRLPLNITDAGDGAAENTITRYTWSEGSADSSMVLPPAVVAALGYTDAYGDDLQGMGSTFFMRGQTGAGVRARETDGINNNRDRTGAGYCVTMIPCDPGTLGCVGDSCATGLGGCSAANMGYLWTALDEDTFRGGANCTADCLINNTCDSCQRIFAPCASGTYLFVENSYEDSRDYNGLGRRAIFLAAAYTGDDAVPPRGATGLVTTTIWRGVGPQASTSGTPSLIATVLDHFVNEGDPAVAIPRFEESDYAKKYWDEYTNLRLMEDVTYGDVMDSLELACASSRADLNVQEGSGAGGLSSAPCSPERLNTIEANGQADISQMEDFLRCSADLVETNAERIVLRNVPLEVVETVQSEFGGATLPQLSGERGVLIDQVAADVIALRTYRLQLTRVMRDLATSVEFLRNDLTRAGILRNQLKLDLQSTVSNQLTACVAAASPSVGAGATYNPGAAIATCANAAVQIKLAISSMQNSLALNEIDQSDAFARFNASYSSMGDTLGQIEVELVASGHRIQSAFTQLENLREESRSALNEAMMYSSDAAGRQLRVNTLLRRRFTTAQDRYQRAREHAMRMAHLAKLALEQRLGVRLSTLREDMTLVDAPARWESRLCTMSGIDFARVRSEMPPDENDETLESYADQYIGDYVDRLRRVAESYRLDFPFHEGADTAVVSMRDVLLDVRDTCSPGVEVQNLLASSGDLGAPAWSTGDTCVPLSVGIDPETGSEAFAARNCVEIRRGTNTATVLGNPSAPWLGTPVTWRVRFGPENAVEASTAHLKSSARTTTRVQQTMPAVQPGEYMLSWYGRAVFGSTLAPAAAIDVTVNGATRALTATGAEGVHGGSCGGLEADDGWCRFYGLLTVSTVSDVGVGLRPNGADGGSVNGAGVLYAPQTVELAGLQFEDVTMLRRAASLPLSEIRPTAFMTTNQLALSTLPVCEDTDGNVFRSDWIYDCERYCPTGFRSDCPEEEAERACFWERSFSINQVDLDPGGRLSRTGFAVGNYNYRADALSLNFVGTNVRDCAGSPFPSGCYGSGFVNYSIEHLGPYPVSNHQGERYEPPLFTGLIESARGLSAERYLTNPLSSADRALIEPYSRGEFRGRPLTGTYVIRIWDDGVVNFDHIEDIQILLDYRYWTRFR